MWVQRQRRWTSIEPTLIQRVVSAGKPPRGCTKFVSGKYTTIAYNMICLTIFCNSVLLIFLVISRLVNNVTNLTVNEKSFDDKILKNFPHNFM